MTNPLESDAAQSPESDFIRMTPIERLVMRSQIREAVSEPVEDMDDDRLKLRLEIRHDVADELVKSLDRSQRKHYLCVQRLNDTDRKLLRAAYGLGVFDSDAANMPIQDEICDSAGLRCDTTAKNSLVRLVDMGFLGNLADYGRRGGYWVTEEGRLVIESPIPHGFGDALPQQQRRP